jgi:hypothetical protein
VNPATAQAINAAACRCWLFQQGVAERLAKDDVRLIRSLEVGQIQTAVDVVEADNARAPVVNGKRTLSCVLDPFAVPALKHYADGLTLD